MTYTSPFISSLTFDLVDLRSGHCCSSLIGCNEEILKCLLKYWIEILRTTSSLILKYWNIEILRQDFYPGAPIFLYNHGVLRWYLWQSMPFDKQCIQILCDVIWHHQKFMTLFERYLLIGWPQCLAEDFDTTRRDDWYGTWPNRRDIDLDLDLGISLTRFKSTLPS